LTRHAAAQEYPSSRRRRPRRLLLALLVIPFLLGGIAGPVTSPPIARGDQLSDARAQQKQLEKKISQQKQLIATLNRSQASLKGQIAATRSQLSGITENLAATRRKVASLKDDIEQVQAEYEDLVAQLADLDQQLRTISAQEAQKKVELGEHKAQLADRIRQAYEAQQTSMLETLLSGASFTDMLVEMTSQLDVAAQDEALARQVSADQATLLALHQTVESARADTNLIRQQTAVQKSKLDDRLAELKAAQAKLRKLEAQAKRTLAAQQAQYAKMAADAARSRKALASAAAAKRKLQTKINRLVAAAFQHGNIPSQYNGTLIWPMPGVVTQPFGCTGFSWEPRYGSCAHFHNGIDIVAPYGTPVRAAGAGKVVYVGWNYADGADPAWIVIIAHSSSLTTWYAHMQPKAPVHAGQMVSQGQVVGYEGSTGHSTGAHLHWMVWLNGTFVNPKLFT
jgi:murein DD-endopeptidase MepM/ murein hydrolase activator NlpD